METLKDAKTTKELLNEPIACSDKKEDRNKDAYKSDRVLSGIRVMDVLNFVRRKTDSHNDLPFYIEITDNVRFDKSDDGEYISEDDKVIFNEVNLERFEDYIPDVFILREVQGFSVELDEHSIIISLFQ